MQIKKIPVGSLQTNCYLLIEDDQCFLIDPGAEPEKIKSAIANYSLIGIGITHAHFDHVGALSQFKELNKGTIFDISTIGKQTCGLFSFDVIPFPGHKEDLVSFYFEKENCMFTGDFLFYHTVGRIDLPGGNREDMLKSIEKIKTYPGSISIFPGHGEDTTLIEEMKNNPYFTF